LKDSDGKSRVLFERFMEQERRDVQELMGSFKEMVARF
jgi:hypothetical protein